MRDAPTPATTVPEQAENDGLQRSPTGTTNGLGPGRLQVDPLRETYFLAADHFASTLRLPT